MWASLQKQKMSFSSYVYLSIYPHFQYSRKLFKREEEERDVIPSEVEESLYRSLDSIVRIKATRDDTRE